MTDRVELGHFTETSIRREDILALAQRVDVFVDEDIEREWGRNVSPAHLEIETDNGATHRLRRGLAARPSPPADVGGGLRRESRRLLSRIGPPLREDAPADCATLSTRSSRARTFFRSWRSFSPPLTSRLFAP